MDVCVCLCLYVHIRSWEWDFEMGTVSAGITEGREKGDTFKN